MSSPREVRDTLKSCFAKVISSDEALRAQGLSTLAVLIEEEGELQLHKSHPTNTQSRELLLTVRAAVNVKAATHVEFVEALSMLSQVEFCDSSLRFAMLSSVLRKVILGVCKSLTTTAAAATHIVGAPTAAAAGSGGAAGGGKDGKEQQGAAAAAAAQQQQQLAAAASTTITILSSRGLNIVTAAAKVWGSLVDGVRDTTSSAGPTAAIRAVFVEALEMLVDGRSPERMAANVLLSEIVLPRVAAVAQQQDTGSGSAVDWRYLFSVLVHATWHPMRDADPAVRGATAATLEQALVVSQAAIAAMLDSQAANAAAATSTANFVAAFSVAASLTRAGREGSPAPVPPTPNAVAVVVASPTSTTVNGSTTAASVAAAAAVMREEWIPSLLGVGVTLMRDEMAPNIVHAALLVNRAVIRAATTLRTSLPQSQVGAVRDFVAQTLRTVNSATSLVRTAVLESLADVAAHDAQQFTLSCLQPVEEA
jgi:hypothetical protein